MTCTFAQYVALSTMFYYYLVFTRFFVLYPSGCLCKIFSPVVQRQDKLQFCRFFYYIYGGEVDKNMWKYVSACSYFYHYELHLRKIKMFCINGMVLQQGKRWASSRLSSQWSENFRRHPLWQFTKSVLYNFDMLCVAEPSEITEHLMTVLPCRRRERCNYDS